ncbi:Major_facilitator [Hexamita inflata]|uniref:Sugar transporter-like n=1 Tax=Hexamita inflata TaxID=28002 RepID=A0ABP1I404_9EUKA
MLTPLVQYTTVSCFLALPVVRKFPRKILFLVGQILMMLCCLAMIIILYLNLSKKTSDNIILALTVIYIVIILEFLDRIEIIPISSCTSMDNNIFSFKIGQYEILQTLEIQYLISVHALIQKQKEISGYVPPALNFSLTARKILTYQTFPEIFQIMMTTTMQRITYTHDFLNARESSWKCSCDNTDRALSEMIQYIFSADSTKWHSISEVVPKQKHGSQMENNFLLQMLILELKINYA